MELHEQLYALGQRLGPDVFNDPDSLRAALDDFMDEGAATTGEINLLVDAVRLGGFRMMLATVHSGGEAARAIEAAGAFLARERGSADVAGSQWACAVLGFAVGAVSAVDVQRFRSKPGSIASPSTPPLQAEEPPPTAMVPPAGPNAAAPPPPPPWPETPSASVDSQAGPTSAGERSQPRDQPGQSGHQGSHVDQTGLPPQGAAHGAPFSPAPETHQWGQAPGSAAPPPYPGLPPKARSARWPIALAAAVVLVVLVVVAVVVLGGGSDDKTAGTPTSSDTSSSGTTTTSAPAAPSTDFSSVESRYSELGDNITTGLARCLSGQTVSGQVERLTCPFHGGDLKLTTFESFADLKAERDQVVNFDTDGRYSKQPTGVFFSQKHEKGRAVLYWDDAHALQSARYQADPAVDLDRLATLFKDVSAGLTYPEGVENRDLRELGSDFLTLGSCERVQTLDPDETEESRCALNGRTVYLVHSSSRASLLAYRRSQVANADRGDHYPWHFTGGADQGTKSLYVDSTGEAVIYWDQTKTNCYAIALASDGNLDRLQAWWAR
jgi:hypothetical protein